MAEFRIPCSPDQIEVNADHLFKGKEIGMVTDERHWMLAQVRAKHSTAKILSADLDVEKAEWILQLDSQV